MNEGTARLLNALLEQRTGQALHPERLWRMETALLPLAKARGLAGVDQLASRVLSARDPALADDVVDALLNNETSFYRDPPVFDLFARQGLARLERLRANERRLAIWSAGCSTGQEVYSIAMLLAREEERWRDWRIDLVGTDVSTRAIATARAGRFSHFEIQRGLSARDMLRWFEREGDQWRAVEPLRARVRFMARSILDAPPQPARFDVIFCRNLLFYLPARARRAAFARLASAIRPDGVLVLGAGETVLGEAEHFVSDYEARGLYRPVIGPGSTRAA